jgi:hypothetical protein
MEQDSEAAGACPPLEPSHAQVPPPVHRSGPSLLAALNRDNDPDGRPQAERHEGQDCVQHVVRDRPGDDCFEACLRLDPPAVRTQ